MPATADTKTNTITDRLKEYGLNPVTAAELQSKFDAITKAQYDRQRTDLQTATNQYYNQLYNTQNTAMDTIRQSNAQAVASGASKGVQAANELSAILGLQSEAATGAADLANQATTLAQDETTAMLENILNAETQAAEQNQALAQLGIQQDSVDVERQNAATAEMQAYATAQSVLEQIRLSNPELAQNLRDWINARYRGEIPKVSEDSDTTANTNTPVPSSGDVQVMPTPRGSDFIRAKRAQAQFGLPDAAVGHGTTRFNGIRYSVLRVDPSKLPAETRTQIENSILNPTQNADRGYWIKNNTGEYLYLIP